MGSLLLHPLKKNVLASHKQVTLDVIDYHVRAGNAYYAWDNTTNIGGETTPADTIEIYFTTPAATSKEICAMFSGYCSIAAAVFVLREAYTAGGGASGDAVLAINYNRSSENSSSLTILKQADAITSGGTVLWTEILAAGKRTVGHTNHYWILKPATAYGVSVFLNGAGVADVCMHWYER